MISMNPLYQNVHFTIQFFNFEALFVSVGSFLGLFIGFSLNYVFSILLYIYLISSMLERNNKMKFVNKE